MTDILNHSLSNREHMIESVKEEIIGPLRIGDNFVPFNPIGNTKLSSKEEAFRPYFWDVGGVKEEILQGETPRQRYVSGLLFPIGTKEEDEVKVEVMTPDDEGTSVESNDDDIKDDDETIDLFPQKFEFMPSSLGLTFCIEKHISKIKIALKGGSYTPHKVYIQGEEKSLNWWLRETVEGYTIIDIGQLAKVKQFETSLELLNKKDQKVSHYSFQLAVRSREINNQLIITVSVVNRSSIDNIGNQEQLILFQSELIASTIGEDSFSKYPKQYDLKEKMSDEETNTELLYRNEGIYAFGHGCATEWDQHAKEVRQIKTTFLPQYEVMSMTPDIETKNGIIKVKMSDLAGLSSKERPQTILKPLLEGYGEWISNKELQIKTLPIKLQKAARNNIKKCKDSLVRMQKGLDLLSNDRILKAFRLANLAMLLQQENGKSKRTGTIIGSNLIFSDDQSIDKFVKIERDLKNADNSWRAFQIAFFLLSIESIVNETSEDRKIVDLIWFPTGGGKTEAYLGVAAFQMLYRRLLNPYDTGTDVIMRYTLRLLTADQFQRSSRLICALEYIRTNNQSELGETPYTIGIWVGSKTSPNKNTEAKSMLMQLRKNTRGAQNFIVHNCPWCGAKLGYYDVKDEKKKGNQKKIYLGYKITDNDHLTLYCPDRNCHFHEELPIHITDDNIYEERPSFLIATIDKFVQIVWKPEARSLFGIDKEGNRFVNPPSLIIQDELHLISGPLGSLTGLFEVLVEELCIKERDSHIIKPKIIAATATIKHFEEQAQALFGRNSAYLFPSPGLEYDDSFFARPAIDKEGNLMPGRKYVGVYTTTVKLMMSQVMTYSALLQSAYELKETERDPFWTLLSFYNTIRELGGGRTLAQTDIPHYSKLISKRKGRNKDTRFPNNVLELTSRRQSSEIAKILDDLKTEYKSTAKKYSSIDICLASNIIEVGVDIDRLSLMTIVGQPKMTAQYIQVSGRVGRRWWERPGLIFTLYSNTKSRDKSHFEHFMEYHQKLYAQVEATSVTPFSDSCLERGLKAIIVGFIRQALSYHAGRTPDWNEIEKYLNNKIIPFYNRLIERVDLIDSEQVNAVKKGFRDIIGVLKNGDLTAWVVEPQINGYMYAAGSNLPKSVKKNAVSMINSMRNVDAECQGTIVSSYQNNGSSIIDLSLEDLFK